MLVGLTRVACEDISTLCDLDKGLRGNGEPIDFDAVRDMADELVVCADAADRCKAVYAALKNAAGKPAKKVKTSKK